MTVSDVMRITLRQVVARQGLPFDVKLPNAQTVATLKQAQVRAKQLRDGTAPRFEKVEDYFAAMDSRDVATKAVAGVRRKRVA